MLAVAARWNSSFGTLAALLSFFFASIASPAASQSIDPSAVPASPAPASPPGPPSIPAPFGLGAGGNWGGGTASQPTKTGSPLPETRRFMERRFLQTVQNEFHKAIRRRKFESGKSCKGIYTVMISPQRTVQSMFRATEDDYWPVVREAFDAALNVLKEEFPEDAVDRAFVMRFGKGMTDCRSIFPFRP